jgi:hypothetical protein
MIDIEYNRTLTDLSTVAAPPVEAAHRARDGEREATQARIAPAVGTRGAALGTYHELIFLTVGPSERVPRHCSTAASFTCLEGERNDQPT